MASFHVDTKALKQYNQTNVIALNEPSAPPQKRGDNWQEESKQFFRSSLTDYTNGNMEENLKHGSLDFYHQEGMVYNWDQTGKSIVTKAEVPKNNVVNLDRIARGLDTRTTLMLRNIPNKVDQQMLKEYIDVTNEATYDFLCEFFSSFFHLVTSAD